MRWDVRITDEAEDDLQDIFDYISIVLKEPGTAAKQIDRILNAVDSLDSMPMRCRAYDEEPDLSKSLRVLPVDNYLILYLPDEKKYTVDIVRVIYGRRDVGGIL